MMVELQPVWAAVLVDFASHLVVLAACGGRAARCPATPKGKPGEARPVIRAVFVGGILDWLELLFRLHYNMARAAHRMDKWTQACVEHADSVNAYHLRPDAFDHPCSR
eukprot:3866083-Amphidinium_carterae.1